MSVYSGFATRQLESTYNRVLFKTIYILQASLAKLLKQGFPLHPLYPFLIGHLLDSKYETLIARGYAKLLNMDGDKHLSPHYSMAFKDLVDHFGLEKNPMLIREQEPSICEGDQRSLISRSGLSSHGSSSSLVTKREIYWYREQ